VEPIGLLVDADDAFEIALDLERLLLRQRCRSCSWSWR
jgi:hypothetical protein